MTAATIHTAHLPTSGDDAHTIWAALVAMIQDVHAPQYTLTDAQWQAAERMVDNYAGPASAEEKIVFDALVMMVHDLPILAYDDVEQATANALLDFYTRTMEGQ